VRVVTEVKQGEEGFKKGKRMQSSEYAKTLPGIKQQSHLKSQLNAGFSMCII